MNVPTKGKTSNNAKSAVAKRPFATPRLRDFGKLHRLTQSTGPSNGDGGQNMMQ